MAEGLLEAPQQDEKTGRFLPGNSGFGGKPLGCRNKLGEAMLADLYEDWKEHGKQAIRDVREDRPSDYLKVIALLVSKLDDKARADGGVTVVNVITRGR